MHLDRLTLTNMRTFRDLDMSLEPGGYVISGPNASGKSNLLEAITLLATARSSRARADIELISRQALRDEPLPTARLAAEVTTAVQPVSVELAVTARAPADAGGRAGATARRFRVNGIARRASDLIGQLRVVPFSADDLQIIAGSPTQRRRYLDITISQLDVRYVRALQRYQRVLTQRNGLLRRLQERRGRGVDELEFWDTELAAAGGVILAGRALALDALAEGAAERWSQLAPSSPPLELRYEPRLPPEQASGVTDGEAGRGTEDATGAAQEALRETLIARRGDDIAAGMTRSGPHRDDVRFSIGDAEAGAFASRGEQRTLALALRLAEVSLSHERTGDPPLLLLDDILSELDAARRERVLDAAFGVDQVVITTPDPDRPGAGELPEARRYRLEGGELRREG